MVFQRKHCLCIVVAGAVTYEYFVIVFEASVVLVEDYCKYRESLDKLKKSKILITCQKNTFGELSSKILLKPSGILLFSRNSEKTVLLN